MVRPSLGAWAALLLALACAAPAMAQPRRAELPLPLPPPPTPEPPPPARGLAGPPAAAAPPPAAARPAPPPQGSWLAIYAAVAPSAAFGISPALPDRLMAHVRAETQCRAAQGGDTCRRLAEVQQGCAVLVQAIRDQRFIRMGTPPPEALARLPVALAVAASAPTQPEAEREAMTQCQERERGLTCRVVAGGCVTEPRPPPPR